MKGRKDKENKNLDKLLEDEEEEEEEDENEEEGNNLYISILYHQSRDKLPLCHSSSP